MLHKESALARAHFCCFRARCHPRGFFHVRLFHTGFSLENGVSDANADANVEADAKPMLMTSSTKLLTTAALTSIIAVLHHPRHHHDHNGNSDHRRDDH